MGLFKTFFGRIRDDFKLKNLMALKLLIFVHLSTFSVLYPYLTIQMRELGINVEETALLSAVTPLVSLIVPPLAGMWADKIGNFKILLALSSGFGGISTLLLLLVPVGRISISSPSVAELLLSCSNNHLQLLQSHENSNTPLDINFTRVNLTIQVCGFVCQLPEETLKSGVTNIRDNDEASILINFSSKSEVNWSNQSTFSTNNSGVHSTLTNLYPDGKNYTSNLRLLNNRIFLTGNHINGLTCNSDKSSTECKFYEKHNFDSKAKELYYKNDTHSVEVFINSKDDILKEYQVNAIHEPERLQSNESHFNNEFERMNCKDYLNEVSTRITVKSKNSMLQLNSCESGCIVTAPHSSFQEEKIIDINPSLTFWSYMSARVLISIVSGTSYAMFEGAVITVLREHNADYGLQRIYGNIGGMISAPLTGLLIDYVSQGKGRTDFRPAFYLYAALKVLTVFFIMKVDLRFKKPARNLIGDLLSVFRKPEIVLLFAACFVMGTSWGFIEAFLFWLLQDIGASQALMGMTTTVGILSGLPVLVMSGPIIEKLGHANVIILSLIFYSIRLVGVSLIYNPWLCLIFEAMECITTTLSFTAAVTYAAALSSATTDTSIQSLLGTTYYLIGRGSGSLFGGYLIKYSDTRSAFQVFSGCTLIAGFIYFLIYHCCFRRRQETKNGGLRKKSKSEEDKAINIKKSQYEISTLSVVDEEVKALTCDRSKTSIRSS